MPIETDFRNIEQNENVTVIDQKKAKKKENWRTISFESPERISGWCGSIYFGKWKKNRNEEIERVEQNLKKREKRKQKRIAYLVLDRQVEVEAKVPTQHNVQSLAARYHRPKDRETR